MYKNRKPLIIGILCVLVLIISITFALLSDNLVITSSSHIDSNWNIKITNIIKNTYSGTVTETEKPTYTDTSASFNVGFSSPGDYIIYDITVENLGTLDAVLDKIDINKQNSSAIIYTINGIKEGNSLLMGQEKTFTIKIEYNSAIVSQPTKTSSSINLTLNYIQNLGGIVNNDAEEKIVGGIEYEIGDLVRFAGANWYVIKDSPLSEDYVVLLKENELTGAELVNNYLLYGGSRATMAYYWSETCHDATTYGADTYSTVAISGCTNLYSSSKVREQLENVYLSTLGENNLKEIDGYKIRLIATGEFNMVKSVTNSASWLKNTVRYWTMTPTSGANRFVNWVNFGNIVAYSLDVKTHTDISVKPVINLYKTAID